MNNLQSLIEDYLKFCHSQKRLDEKTLKAYRIDLRQFYNQTSVTDISEITSQILEDYIARLHQQYMPRLITREKMHCVMQPSQSSCLQPA